MSKVLKLDAQGQPHEWLTHQEAICYHAKNMVVWQLYEGEGNDVMFRGGVNRITGIDTRIITAPIIAVRGESHVKKRFNKTPALTNSQLFRRDHNLCAYCGKVFSDQHLTRDHIIPTSRKGTDTWMNVVTACKRCNHGKDDSLLEECGMQLLYVPYVPSFVEELVLKNRNVLACQMDYLKAFIPEQSRVWKYLQ